MIVDENQPTSDLREAILSKRNLETLLVQKLHIKLPINLKQFRAGQSNPTLLVEDAKGQKYVIRKKPNGSIISTAHNIKREYTVLAALSNTSVPVPKMFLYCTDTKIFGTEFYVTLSHAGYGVCARPYIF
jgi:aminoglycoside phosphotransferase (APT) family kinase protein